MLANPSARREERRTEQLVAHVGKMREQATTQAEAAKKLKTMAAELVEKMPSALSEDRAPSAILDHWKARGSPARPSAPPEQRRGSPWPQQLASAGAQDFDFQAPGDGRLGVPADSIVELKA